MPISSFWRARVAPVFSPQPGRDVFGRILPFNERLESISAKYSTWRIGTEPDAALARRAAIAALELREMRSQEISTIDADVEELLALEKALRPCDF
jgi:hypothetical protein